jgi:hypothetical protein
MPVFASRHEDSIGVRDREEIHASCKHSIVVSKNILLSFFDGTQCIT